MHSPKPLLLLHQPNTSWQMAELILLLLVQSLPQLHYEGSLKTGMIILIRSKKGKQKIQNRQD